MKMSQWGKFRWMIIDHLRENGNHWVAPATLARGLAWDKERLQGTMKAMEAEGLLTSRVGIHTPKVYRLR